MKINLVHMTNQKHIYRNVPSTYEKIASTESLVLLSVQSS